MFMASIALGSNLTGPHTLGWQARRPVGLACARGCRLSPPLCPRRWCRRAQGAIRRRTTLVCPKAALYHLPNDLVSSLQTGVGIAWMLALPFSALPILTGEAKERNQQRTVRPTQDQGLENVRWSVMGVLSFIPFLNWLVRRGHCSPACAAQHSRTQQCSLSTFGNQPFSRLPLPAA